MSNRRKARNPLPINPDPTRPIPGLPPQLQDLTRWTDTPPAQYTRRTLEWIVRCMPERMRLNVWVCETCGTGVLCYDLHPGTTPYAVSHHTLGDKDCAGTCTSRMYSGVDAAVWRAQLGGPSHEWYRPSVVELAKASRPVREHVLMGGLLVRRVPEPEPAPAPRLILVEDITDPAAPTAAELLAGPVVDFRTEQGTVVRQRCQWCGAVFVDECTWLVQVPVGQDSTIPTWEPGRFVDVVAPDGRGGMWSLNAWTEGPVPDTACLRMPLEVTA